MVVREGHPSKGFVKGICDRDNQAADQEEDVNGDYIVANAGSLFLDQEVKRIAQASGVQGIFCSMNYSEIGFTVRLKIIYQKKHKQTLIDVWNVQNWVCGRNRENNRKRTKNTVSDAVSKGESTKFALAKHVLSNKN